MTIRPRIPDDMLLRDYEKEMAEQESSQAASAPEAQAVNKAESGKKDSQQNPSASGLNPKEDAALQPSSQDSDSTHPQDPDIPVDLSADQNKTKNLAAAGIKKRNRRNWITIACLFLVLILLAGLCLRAGNTVYSWSDIMAAIAGTAKKSVVYTIRSLRLPRIIGGILAGASFGMAGYVLQRLLNNPLASPDIIGVSAGSSVAAVFCLSMLHLSGPVVFAAAVICGIGTTVLIYFLAHGQSYNDAKLILIGIGMQAFLQAILSWLLLLASEYNVGAAMRWMAGSLNTITGADIPILFLTTLTGGAGIALLGRHLDSLQLGPAFAKTLGAKPDVTRTALVLLAVGLCAFATAATGPIAAVAFLSGPIAHRLCNTGKAPLLAAALTGSVLVLGADWIGQYILPYRYPVGIVTGLLGAPYLLVLLMHMQNRK